MRSSERIISSLGIKSIKLQRPINIHADQPLMLQCVNYRGAVRAIDAEHRSVRPAPGTSRRFVRERECIVGTWVYSRAYSGHSRPYACTHSICMSAFPAACTCSPVYVCMYLSPTHVPTGRAHGTDWLKTSCLISLLETTGLELTD